MQQIGNAMIFIVTIGIITGIITFFLPTIIAFFDNKNNKWKILILNILTGWTGIGLIILAMWATRAEERKNDIGTSYAWGNTKESSKKTMFTILIP